MKKLTALILLITCTNPAGAFNLQRDTIISTEKTRKNSCFFELGGAGLLYSVNYERIVYFKPNRKMALRAGCEYTGDLVFLPFTVSGIAGLKNNFEYGTGITLVPGDKDPVGFTASLGYRYSGKKGFLLRGTALLFYVPGGFFEFVPWAGLSFGYSF